MSTNPQELHAFIEKLSYFFGVESRMPRSVARVLSYLLMCEPPHQSAAQIAAALKLSTGSVSGAVTTLQQIGLIRRVTFPGDRHYYYESDPEGWKQALLLRLKAIPHGIALAQEGLKISQDKPGMQAMLDMYKIFEGEVETLVARLEKTTQPSGGMANQR